MAWLYSRLNKFKFVGRFDIASYYNSINHSQLLNLIRSEINNKDLYHVIKEYLELPDYMNTGKGIVAGCSISPLIGALYLLPLDRAMQKNVASGKIFYLRFMDDIIILSKRRWHFKEAIKKMNEIVSSLGLLLHQEKRFIGIIKKGFDFLGYQFTSGKKLRPSEISLQRFTEHARQLYEQGADYNRLRLYVIRWLNYTHGGLHCIVSRKGGLKHYLALILKKLDFKNITKLM